MNNIRLSILLIATACLFGCETAPAPIIIHQDLSHSIRIMYDPQADPPHHHPYDLTPAQFVHLLKGVWVKDRNSIVGFGLFTDQHGQPAFTNREVAFLAPYLSRALKKVSPKDLVTFFLVENGGKRGSLITSGGLYVQEHRLYFILANHQTALSDTSNLNVTGTELDNRDYPLEPIGRYQFSVGFSPADSWIPHDRAQALPGDQPYLDPSLRIVIDLKKFFGKTKP